MACAREPADREIHSCLAHQPPILHDPQQKSRQHQPDRHFRIDPGPHQAIGVKVSYLHSQPGKVQNRVHTRQNMIVRNKITQRAADEELKLITLFPTQHRQPHCP
jgi:hypothetical protein